MRSQVGFLFVFVDLKNKKGYNQNMMNEKGNKMEKIISLAKRRGFIFQSSEIYGGLSSCYDYGPLGVELKNNVKKSWWQEMVQKRDDVVGLDAAILMRPEVWQASGHLSNFSDPLVECKNCHKRYRADHLIEKLKDSTKLNEHGFFTEEELKDLDKAIKKIKCPECESELTPPRQFNLMFKTFMGPVEETSATIYLRPETAQGIFVNYENVRSTMRKKIPFGIAQIGKAFRNEITPGNFTFRTREFEQMEMEYFVRPKEAGKAYNFWQKERLNWYKKLGIKKKNLRLREHQQNELAHYAASCSDIEYNFPIGWSELEGIANRQDYDLKQHSQFSGKDLNYFDEETKEKYIPYVIEPSAGVDRSVLAFLADAYDEVKGGRTTTTESNKETEIVLRLHKDLAPIKIAILPLAKKDKLTKIAKNIFHSLQPYFMCQYDEQGSIGRRYRRQDEIGTPYCLTVDFDSLEDKAVTVRDRDTMKQERIKMEEIKDYLKDKFKNF